MFDITTYILSTKTAAAIAGKAAGGKTVDVQTSSGQLDEDALNTLKESKSNIIILQDKVYRLSRIEGADYKYINSLTDGSSQIVKMTELNINIDTGEFETKILIIEGQAVEELIERLEHHESNFNIHVSEEDRNNWNNKVTAEAVQIDLSTNYMLNLSK